MLDDSVPDDPALDNPVLSSLAGTHRALALADGRALRFPAEVSPFMAVPDDAAPEDWRRLAGLADGDPIVLVNPPPSLPGAWTLVNSFAGLQMIAPAEPFPAGGPRRTDWSVRPLGPADAADMLELAATTKPGPFGPRTRELGAYLGVRDGGRLIAMAGERLQPNGWTEISAVCTDPDYRGHGLARMLMERVAEVIWRRGDRPFLHVVEENTGAIRLYESMGYTTRRSLLIGAYRAA